MISKIIYLVMGIITLEKIMPACDTTRNSENNEDAIKRCSYDGVIQWKYFPGYRPFVRGIYRSSVNSTHKGESPGALMFSLICTSIIGWVNNRKAGDLSRHRAHYDVTVMVLQSSAGKTSSSYSNIVITNFPPKTRYKVIVPNSIRHTIV